MSFPNPQDALPLPLHPDLEQYRKLAKDLVKACESEDRVAAIGRWTDRWLEALGRNAGSQDHGRAREGQARAAAQVEEFALRHLEGSCRLSEAQFVIARCHGFLSWPAFVEHVERLVFGGTDARFEAAADAIVAGDEAALRRLLDEHPELVHQKSKREHAATLLIYTSANGVEGYRQKTPPNIVAITRLLLERGAEVDATSPVYGGSCTTLGLVATSAWPRLAGTQLEQIQLLLDHGADIEHPDLMGNRHHAVQGCLANGCPEAARFLADQGAYLGIVEAAAVGRLDVVRSYFHNHSPDPREAYHALLHACSMGEIGIVTYLLDRGVPDRIPAGELPIHWAAFNGQIEVVRLLLERKPPLEQHNDYGGTVLTGTLWAAAHGKREEKMIPVIEALIAAGARVPGDHAPVTPAIDALLARHGSVTNYERRWLSDDPPERASRKGS